MARLPHEFDQNEWFVLISMLIVLGIFFLLRRVIPRKLALTILVFFAALGLMVDVLIGMDYPADFYVIMDSNKLDLFDMLVYFVNYPVFGYFYSHIIYKWRMQLTRLLWFVPLWALLAVLIEALSVIFNVFSYKNGWGIGYSAIAYILIYAFSAAVIKLFIHIWTVQKEGDAHA